MKKQKRVKAVKRRRPYFKGRLLMRLLNWHAGTIFSGVRQRKGKKKDYSDYRGEIQGQPESTGSAQMASARPIRRPLLTPSK